MILYQAYGLTLASTLPLPELLPGKGAVDVYIDLQKTEKHELREPSPIQCVTASPTFVHLIWGDVGELMIDRGNRIKVICGAVNDEAALRLFVLGAGLGVLLHQRGLLVFHASSVAIKGRAVGFLGAKGWGKSTTAAALHQQGHALISDELLVVRFDDQNGPMAIAGSQQIRLWKDALSSAGGNPKSASRVRSGIDKFNFATSQPIAKETPFYCLYLLAAGNQLSIKEMPLNEAFISIIPHLYVYRFGTAFLQLTDFSQPIKQIKELLDNIIVKRLARQKNLEKMTELAQLVEKDFLSSI